MEFDGGNLLNDGDGFGGGGGGEENVDPAPAAICCSICLDSVTDDCKRSWAKLQCSHQFHLDCIGSAFNAKGTMQCPNCRKIEKGQWRYATGTRSLRDNNIIGNPIPTHDSLETFFDESYRELPQLPPTYDDFSSTTSYVGDDTSDYFLWGLDYGATPTAASSSGPHIGMLYEPEFNPLLPTSHAISSEIPAASYFLDLYEDLFVFPTTSNSHTGGRGDEQRTAVSSVSHRGRRIPTTYDDPRQHGSYVVDQSNARSRSSFNTSTMINPMSMSSVTTSTTTTRVHPYHPYPDSVARAHERVEALEAYFQQQSSNPTSYMRASSNGIIISGPSGRSNGQNHAADRVPWISSGRDYHPQPGNGYEAAGVRSQNARRRYRGGGGHSQNRW